MPSCASKISGHLPCYLALFLAFCLAAPVEAETENAYMIQIPHDGDPISIRSWLVAGMFLSPERTDQVQDGQSIRSAFDTDYLASIGGEVSAEPDSGTSVSGPDGRKVGFKLFEWDTPYVDLIHVFGRQTNVCAYLYAELDSPVEQDVYIHMGFDDTGKAWLNGELVIANSDDGGITRPRNVARVRLRPGRARLLVKVDQARGGWGAFVEVRGSSAHENYVIESFPRVLHFRASSLQPAPGEHVDLQIANWIPWPPEPIQVEWVVTDGERRTLDQTGEHVRIEIADGASRIVRVRATAQNPGGGLSVMCHDVVLTTCTGERTACSRRTHPTQQPGDAHCRNSWRCRLNRVSIINFLSLGGDNVMTFHN